MMPGNILIAYYSWGGSTRRVAEQIHALIAGESFEITPQEAYPGDYNACTVQAKKEIQAGYKPVLKKNNAGDIGRFAFILLGSPNWWSSIAPPAAAFLAEYDLKGKTIVPFCTHGGGGQGHLVKDIAKLCPGSTVLSCLAVRDGSLASKGDLSDWLKQAGIKIT
jgi:flavodoxin